MSLTSGHKTENLLAWQDTNTNPIETTPQWIDGGIISGKYKKKTRTEKNTIAYEIQATAPISARKMQE